MEHINDDQRGAELDALQVLGTDDLQRMWELLMEPLGFSSRSLWITLIGEDRRPTRLLIEVADAGELPEGEAIAGLFSVLEQMLRDEGGECSAAFLITRPGRGGPDRRDAMLGRMLLEGARRADVPLETLHVADDRAVQALRPDDLAA